jgi:hypothetical protein
MMVVAGMETSSVGMPASNGPLTNVSRTVDEGVSIGSGVAEVEFRDPHFDL